MYSVCFQGSLSGRVFEVRLRPDMETKRSGKWGLGRAPEIRHMIRDYCLDFGICTTCRARWAEEGFRSCSFCKERDLKKVHKRRGITETNPKYDPYKFKRPKNKT